MKYLFLFSILFLSITACKDSKTGQNNNDTEIVVSQYTSEKTKADKRKYYDQNNNVVYEVKYKSDGFKLRTASSTLLWKVKLYNDKVKISNNEENLNAYEIKKVGANEIKLEKDNEIISRNKNTSHLWELVADISEIPADQQEILVAELKAKGL